VPSIQEQYTEFAKRSQDAALAVVDTWTQTFQDTVVQLPAITTKATAQHAVDQFFDYAGTVLDIQRKVAKQLVTATVAAAEDVSQQATRAATKAADEVGATTGRAKKTAS
jgi:hypothetical protein